ncbi:asparagine synthase (glutamine-hydrolyzing) [Nitratifractor sp.]
MCGIAGGVNCRVDARRVCATLHHRGPDAHGEATVGPCRLFHTRLAIQDLSEQGAQPMKRRGCTIVFNGEIYNHISLRKELLGDETFRGTSDTETLLALYLRYGEGMFSRLDGMFAFAVVDERDNTLFLATDRAGKKPLFLYRKGTGLFFASELKVIAENCDVSIDEASISAYLRTGFFYGRSTPYREVERLEAGSWLRVDLSTLKREEGRYFRLEELYRDSSETTGAQEAIELLDAKLRESVRRRLLSSDREVGAFLSGGIDSSLVVAMASEHTDRLKTFTVAFEGSYDESELAELTARRYGTEHRTLRIEMNLREDVERILAGYGMPFSDSSAIPSWYVSQAAAEHVTVVLNGDGADELFAGYRRYVPLAGRWIKRIRPFAPLQKLLPNPGRKQSIYNYLYRLLGMAGKEGLDFYLSATTDIFEEIYRFGPNPILEEMDRSIRRCRLEGLSRMLCLDFEILLFSDLLVKMDIATMAHSLEARSPFLGKEILELAPKLPDRFKIRGTTTKWILRRLAERYLPEALISQPKRGFEVPLVKWVDGVLREQIADALAPGCYSETYLDRAFIEKLREGRGAFPVEKRAKMLWSLYALEIWRRGS